MKKIFLLFSVFLISSCLLHSQDWISIIGKSPYPANTKVYFTGYNGFEKIDLGSIRSNAQGEIDFFTDYHGFCMMSAEGAKPYPVILEHDPVCIEWNDPPVFSCEPENAFFYAHLPELKQIESMQMLYFSVPDSLPGKDSLRTELQGKMELLFEELMQDENLHARVFLLSDLFVMQCKMVDSTEQMAEWKEDLLAFADIHFEILNSSVYLGKLGKAYVDMNRTVFKNENSKNQAMEYDVGKWVELFGEKLSEKAIVEFFCMYFIQSGESATAAILLSKYIDIVKCDQWVGGTARPANMPYTFNVFFGPDFSNVRSLDQFRGTDKILAFVSTECPASVAAVAALFEFVNSSQVRLPVILVPDYELEGELGALVEKRAPFSLRTGYKYGGPLMQGAGIKQLPAFMILDRQNLVKEVIYDLKLLEERIGK